MENQTTGLKTDEMSFDKMILSRTKQLAKQYDYDNYGRLRESVTMVKRYRGDYYGFFNPSNRSLDWTDIRGKNLLTYPVIPRAIKASTATFVSTDIQITIEPSRNIPELEAGAELAQNVWDSLKSELYTETVDSTCAHLAQTARCYFLYTRHVLEGGIRFKTPIEEEKQVEIDNRTLICLNCGNEVPPMSLESGVESQESESLASQESMNMTPDFRLQTPDLQEFCPFCGGQNFSEEGGIDTETIKETVGYNDEETGEIILRTVSPMLMRVDEHNGIGNNLDACHWLNYHPLVPVYEILAEFPHLKDKIKGGDVSKWSDATQWWHQLRKHSGNYGHGYGATKDHVSDVDQLTEINFWWFQPIACHGWKSPDYYCLKDKEGNARFDVQPGETIAQAFDRQNADNPDYTGFNGMWVMLWCDELLGVISEDFKDLWVCKGWIDDPNSFFPIGQERLLAQQDAMTNLLSMCYSHILRRSNPKLVASGMYFRESDLKNNQPGAVILAKQEVPRSDTFDLKRHIFELPGSELPATTFNFISLMIDVGKEDSGIFNEVTGAGDKNNKTLGGQQIMLSRSLQLMSQPIKSKKQALCRLAKNVLKLAQNMPDAFFVKIKGTFDEEWKEQDILAFRALDIDSDVKIKEVKGTDIPKSIPEMQQNFMLAMQIGLLTAENPMPLQIRARVLKEVLGIDYDIENYEADRRVAANRLRVIKQKAKQINPADLFIVDEKNGQMVLNPEVRASVLEDVRTRIMSRQDNHIVMIEYYNDVIKGLSAVRQPDEVLIEVLIERVNEHLLAMVENNAEQQAGENVAAVAGQAAGQAVGQSLMPQEDPNAAAQAEMESQMAMQDEERQREDDKFMAELDEKEREREFQKSEAEANRTHEIDLALLQMAAKEGQEQSAKR